MKPFVIEVSDLDPLRAFRAVKHLPYSLLFDSSDDNHPESRYSFVMCHPIETIEAKNSTCTVTNWDQRLSLTGDPFALMQDRMNAWIPISENIEDLPPFQGGAAGVFSYDLGRYVENLPEIASDTPSIPDMAIGIYDQVYAFDHHKKKGWLFTHARNETEAIKKRQFLLGLFYQNLEPLSYSPIELKWSSNFDKAQYIENVKKVIEYIHAGDIFQANISQRFDASLPKDFDPFAHYIHLRKINPAPFATYMNLGSVKISSASPERFLTVTDKQVITNPIKGTRPHVKDILQDRIYREELLNSEKDRAENIMIVDLLRNDLSKVCESDSISAFNLCQLETFASVHHLVSTVRGKLKNHQHPVDLLRACFPGGSITGAPKIRAMEIIEEIEPSRRGPYCGSAGYIGFNGNMDSNILIRTLIYNKNKLSLQAGGGIVADSVPEEEYQETIDKAVAILSSFESIIEENTNTAIATAI